jgi:hypothetical protein
VQQLLLPVRQAAGQLNNAHAKTLKLKDLIRNGLYHDQPIAAYPGVGTADRSDAIHPVLPRLVPRHDQTYLY